jgi:UDP-galactopyranose mutase
VSAARTVVLGAGPTGLSAALTLGADATLVEREATVGGCCRSMLAGGFTFDMAGHTMFSNDAYVHDLYERLLGDNVQWQEREAWVYSKGMHTRHAVQGALYALPPTVMRERLATNGNGHANGNGHSNGNGDANGNGHSNGNGHHGENGNAANEELSNGNARFGYPLKGGFQALMNGFLPYLRADLRLETEAVRVCPTRRTVVLSDGSSLPYDAVVSTIPLPRLVRLLGPEAPPSVRDAAAGLRHLSVRCVNLGVGRPDLTEKHWIYYPEETVFHRILVQGNASPHCNPPGGFGLTCEITYSKDHPLPCDDDELIRRCIADCRAVGLVGENDPIWTACQVDLPYAYVVHDHGRGEHVEHIRAWLLERDLFLAGRFSEWEHSKSDHAFVAGRDAALAARERCASRRAARHPGLSPVPGERISVAL